MGNRTLVHYGVAGPAAGPTVESSTYDADNRLSSREVMVTDANYDIAAHFQVTVTYQAKGWLSQVAREDVIVFFGNCVEEDVTDNVAETVTDTAYAYDGWNPATLHTTGTSRWEVWGEVATSGGVTELTQFLRGDQVDQVFAAISDQAPWSGLVVGGEWLLTDHLGSVVGVADFNGALQVTMAYDAFGNMTSTTSVNGGPEPVPAYQWTGQRADAATGLDYMRARFYDPTTGRFITQDPLGFDAGDR